MSYFYLASPYTNPDNPADLDACKERHAAACSAAAKLMQEGHAVFSPIAHSHAIADHMDEALRSSYKFWLEQDFALLTYACKLVVLKLPGWERSFGVKKEIEYAERLCIPVTYMDPV